MMKNSFVLIAAILFSAQSFGNEQKRYATHPAPYDRYFTNEVKGQIVVLDAPLFSAPSWDAKILARKRKGQLIYIHPKDRRPVQYREDLNVFPDADSSDFYLTITQDGKDAFVPKDFVHILYKDEREFDNKLPKPDITDYRPPEPLAKSYPFIIESPFSAELLLGTSFQQRKPYPFPSDISESHFQPATDFAFKYLYAPQVDRFARFAIGMHFTFQYLKNSFVLGNGNGAEINFVKFGAGPWAQYRLFQNKHYNVHFGGGFDYHFLDRISIEQTGPTSGLERRLFDGFSIVPKAEVSLTIPKVTSTLDFVVSALISKEIYNKYRAISQAQFSDWWNTEDDSISFQNAPAELSLFVGFKTWQ